MVWVAGVLKLMVHHVAAMMHHSYCWHRVAGSGADFKMARITAGA